MAPLAALTAGLSPGVYVVGVLTTAIVIAALGWGAFHLRSALLPAWSGSAARLAEVVTALAVLIGVAQVLGTIGAFTRGPMLVAYVAVGLSLGVVGKRLMRRGGTAEVSNGQLDEAPQPCESVERSPRVEVVAAILAGGLVAAQWATHVAVAYGRGMTQPDTLWYHATFAARFLQTGRLTGLHNTGLSDLATPLHTFLPLNGSLVQAIAMMPFGNDFLSPLVNIAWATLALLAAACLGRRCGAPCLMLLATLLLLGLPTLAGTQPGQAANDIATTALFLAAIALLFEGQMAPTPTTLAGIAAGLALGTKLTVLVPLVVVTIAVVVVAIRARRARVALLWSGELILFGGYWFARNWIIFGNPVPWTTLHLGPFTLSSQIPSRPPLADVLGDWSTWDTYILPGFSKSLGRGWPVTLALALAGAVVAIVWGRGVLERFAGGAVIAGFVAVAYIQYGSDFGGAAFVFMVRYLAPSLVLGFALATIAAGRGSTLVRRILLAVLVGLVVLDATAPHIENIPSWPTGQRLTAVLVGLGVVAIAGAIAFRPRLSLSASSLAIAASVLVILMVGGGWVLQRSYFDNRYVDAGLPHDRLNAMFRDVHNKKIALFGTEHFYPFFGVDLSNRVSREQGPSRGSPTERCRGWRRLIDAGGYDYVVVAHDLFALAPDDEWIADDPAANDVLHSGNATVYRVRGSFDPSTCM
jgi:hypothetical protein